MPEREPQKSASTGKSYTKREAEVSDVELISPHGTKITVPKRRADELLARNPLELPGGKREGYKLANESKPTPKPGVTNA